MHESFLTWESRGVAGKRSIRGGKGLKINTGGCSVESRGGFIGLERDGKGQRS